MSSLNGEEVKVAGDYENEDVVSSSSTKPSKRKQSTGNKQQQVTLRANLTPSPPPRGALLELHVALASTKAEVFERLCFVNLRDCEMSVPLINGAFAIRTSPRPWVWLRGDVPDLSPIVAGCWCRSPLHCEVASMCTRDTSRRIARGVGSKSRVRKPEEASTERRAIMTAPAYSCIC